ncbi:MAG: 30S ribosomal protein S20 [Verrucomicrobia bacterium]|nr:30S ribosomal protein S20 [Verrucomicrobiota bacterium]
MAEEKAKKTKRPTALKRVLTSEKRRVLNKSFRSEVRTTLRDLETELKKGKSEELTRLLNEAYAVLDKSAKRGVFKLNKVSRMKARYAIAVSNA